MANAYDVFLSFKHLGDDGAPTTDSALARQLHSHLAARGLNPFFSELSLEEGGAADFKAAIDNALDTADVLVLVATKRGHAQSRWVQYEWESFLNDILSGLKPSARLFLYLDGVHSTSLPRGLRKWQAVKHGGRSMDVLANFILNSRTNVVDVIAGGGTDDARQSRRTLRESIFLRKVRDTLVRLGERESVALSVDPESLEVASPEENAETIAKSGYLIIANGYPAKIEQLYSTLGPQEKSARVRCVYASALFAMGRYMLADGVLAEIELGKGELSVDEQQYADYQKAAVSLATGRIDMDRFKDLEGVLESSASGLIALQFELNRARRHTLAKLAAPDLSTAVGDLARVVGRLDTAGEEAWPIQIRARTMLLQAKGELCVREASRSAIFLGSNDSLVRREYLGGRSVAQVTEDVQRRWSGIDRELDALAQLADQKMHLPLLCEVLLARVGIYVGMLIQERLLSIVVGNGGPLQSDTGKIRGDIERALAIAERCGLVEESVRGLLMGADLSDVCDEVAAAKKAGEVALRMVRAMRLAAFEEWASDHASGTTILRRGVAAMTIAKNTDGDMAAASMTDDELDAYASESLRLLHIPGHRIGIVRRAVQRMRFMAQQKVSWCRHLEAVEPLGHLERLETKYAALPVMRSRCAKHGYASTLETVDESSSVDAFRAAHCPGCHDRSPIGG